MQAKIIAIGNSRGVRLPKKILQAANLDEVESVNLTITSEGLLLSRPTHPRAGWEEAFRAAPHTKPEDLWGDIPLDEAWDH
jgi:antitoxin MazE